jgi:O-methyltransferase involved in polyketide biosynthesis
MELESHTLKALVSAYEIARKKIFLSTPTLIDENTYTEKFLTSQEIEFTKTACEIFRQKITLPEDINFSLKEVLNKSLSEIDSRFSDITYLARNYFAKQQAEKLINGTNDFRQVIEIGHGFDFSFADLALANPEKNFYFVELEPISKIYEGSLKTYLNSKGIELPKNIKFISCDLEKENVFDKLKDSGIDFNIITYSNMIGVASHLKPNTFKNFLNEYSNSFADKSLINFTMVSPQNKSHINTLDRDNVKNLIENNGFSMVEAFGYDTINKSILQKVIQGNTKNELDGTIYLCSVEREKNIGKTNLEYISTKLLIQLGTPRELIQENLILSN